MAFIEKMNDKVSFCAYAGIDEGSAKGIVSYFNFSTLEWHEQSNAIKSNIMQK